MTTTTATREPQHMLAPPRSLDQRRKALRVANRVRVRRAALKRDLKAGRVDLASLIARPPDYLETARAWDLLMAVPKYGRVKVNRVLTQCRISPSKTIGGMSVRQRQELAAALARDAGTIRRGR